MIALLASDMNAEPWILGLEPRLTINQNAIVAVRVGVLAHVSADVFAEGQERAHFARCCCREGMLIGVGSTPRAINPANVTGVRSRYRRSDRPGSQSGRAQAWPA